MEKLYSLIYYVFPKNVKCLNLDSYQILFFSMIKQPMSLKSFAFIAWLYGVHTCVHVQSPCGMAVVYSTILLFISSDRSLNGPEARTAASKSVILLSLPSQVLESRHMHSQAQLFTQILEIQSHIFMLAWPVLLLTEPSPSPTSQFLWLFMKIFLKNKISLE